MSGHVRVLSGYITLSDITALSVANSTSAACRCGLPLLAPSEARCWRPAIEPEPSFTLVPYGCDPAFFRAIRTPSGLATAGHACRRRGRSLGRDRNLPVRHASPGGRSSRRGTPNGTGDMMQAPGDAHDALVSALNPDMIRRIEAEHVPNDHGDCRSCSGYRSTRWPCALASAAAAARGRGSDA